MFLCVINTNDYSQAIKSVEGGSELFLNFVWSSRLLSMAALEMVLQIENPPLPYMVRIRQAARPSGPPGRSDFKSMLLTFLSGSGIPNEDLFNEVKHTFNSLIDLSQISSPFFRPRMFVWAATGSPFIGSDQQDIAVSTDTICIAGSRLIGKL